jgi:hypothetical protein
MEQSSRSLDHDKEGNKKNTTGSERVSLGSILREPKPEIKPNLESIWQPKAVALDKEKTQVEPRPRMPDADEAWANIEQQLRADPEFTRSTEAALREELRVPIPETSLPLDEGRIHELPLDPIEATEIHKRLQEFKTKDKDELPPDRMPDEEPQVEAAVEPEHELPSEPAPRTSEQAVDGGGNFEPPRPPRSNEQPLGSPEPEPQPIITNEEAPTWSSKAEEEHQARLAGAVSVGDLSPAVATPTSVGETRIIDRSGDGAALALGVGFIDWRRGRKIKRELRRGQKRQDKKIKSLQASAKQNVEQHNTILNDQRVTNEKLRDRLVQLSNQVEKSEKPSTPTRVAEQPKAPSAPSETQEPSRAKEFTEKLVQLPPEHRVEKSAWHNIEVDRTGRAVENPVHAYGSEFRREQHQEAHQDTTQLAVASGHLAINSSVGQKDPPALASKLQIPKTMREDAKPKYPIPKLPPALQKPWVLIVLIIAFFVVACLIVLL